MRVSAIYTYPVKGCHRLDHDIAVVEPWGIEGDRRWLIVDPAGIAITQRDVPGLALLRARPGMDGLTLSYPDRPRFLVPPLKENAIATGNVWENVVAATPAGQAANAWLSETLKCEARLLWLDDPMRRPVGPPYANAGDRVSFADGYPLLLTNTASLDQLNEWMGEPLPMNRFRPNVVIETEKPFIEDEWTGQTIRIGQMAFRVANPCARCVVTTTDQDTGVRGREPLRTLAKYRNVDQELLFGTNLIPVAPGVIRIDDPVNVR